MEADRRFHPRVRMATTLGGPVLLRSTGGASGFGQLAGLKVQRRSGEAFDTAGLAVTVAPGTHFGECSKMLGECMGFAALDFIEENSLILP